MVMVYLQPTPEVVVPVMARLPKEMPILKVVPVVARFSRSMTNVVPCQVHMKYIW